MRKTRNGNEDMSHDKLHLHRRLERIVDVSTTIIHLQLTNNDIIYALGPIFNLTKYHSLECDLIFV